MEEDASRGTAWRKVLAEQWDSVEEDASRGTAWRRMLAGGQRGGRC